MGRAGRIKYYPRQCTSNCMIEYYYQKICVAIYLKSLIHLIRAKRMSLKMKKEYLLPLFKNFMESTRGNCSIKPITFLTPIDCQVVSTVPRFVVSDGFHKVRCNISKEAMLEFKTYHPSVTIKDLSKRIVTLIEYAPYTRLDSDKGLQFELHIYNFRVHSLEGQRCESIVGKPRDLEGSQEIKSESGFEVHKKLRCFISKQKFVDEIPHIEDIKFQKPVKCSERVSRPINCSDRKEGPYDEAGKLMLDYRRLEQMEDVLSEEAGRLLTRRKAEWRRQRELGREVAKRAREKPQSLGKELVQWADRHRSEGAKKGIGVIKEGVARILAKEGLETRSCPRNLRSLSKNSINKSIQSKRPTAEKGKVNVSEIKFTAKSFRSFLQWRESAGIVDGDTNSVADLLQKGSPGMIKVGFAVPGKAAAKAFDGWVSSKTFLRKRETPSGAGSCRKSTAKRPKL
eukprot:TRINITY_DN12941_c0_g5_i1.p1 TRINITY_DN12941_c0_g5~~TRINITY_DN12941_c0_g5_i1.p1  ORF type:complete len:455 (+),score=114.09 TRINITY_DN12941_c0_g5_i1:111-1475(+)